MGHRVRIGRGSRRTVGLVSVAVVVAAGAVAGWLLWPSGDHRPVVALAGDSLLYQAAPVARDVFGQHGYRAENRSTPGTGLLDADFRWTSAMPKLLDQLHPEIVVLEFAGDFLPPRLPGIAYASKEFFARWAEQTSTLIAEVDGAGATPYLVLIPPMPGPTDVAERLNADYRALVAHGNGGLGCIDAHAPFTGPDGGYAATVSVGGHPTRVRSQDGVHFTAAGEQRFASVIASVVAAQGTHPTARC